MNQKGLMFTLEVMIALIILAVAIGTVLNGSTMEMEKENFINSTNQSHRITAVYFNENYPDSLGKTIICGDYWEYSNGSVSKSTICEGYE